MDCRSTILQETVFFLLTNRIQNFKRISLDHLTSLQRRHYCFTKWSKRKMKQVKSFLPVDCIGLSQKSCCSVCFSFNVMIFKKILHAAASLFLEETLLPKLIQRNRSLARNKLPKKMDESQFSCVNKRLSYKQRQAQER